MAAACGAAQEVPKKLGKGEPLILMDPKFTVVLTPSGATKSGLFLTTPLTGVPPCEEKDSTEYGFTPYAGVFLYRTAPTAMAPAAFA